jgi:peptidoglycan/LPS O-acetylase OafA/YrhL
MKLESREGSCVERSELAVPSAQVRGQSAVFLSERRRCAANKSQRFCVRPTELCPIYSSLRRALVILWLTIAFIAKYEFELTSRPVLWTQIIVLSLVVWGALRWRLGHGVWAYIGRLSYSMYLFHFAVLYFLERSFTYRWPYLGGFAFAFLPTLAIAIVSQRTAEKWSQDVGRYLIASMDRKCAAKALPLREH